MTGSPELDPATERGLCGTTAGPAPLLVYIAGPYRGATAWDVEQNIRAAEALGAEVARLGAYPIIPHSNTRYYFEHFQPGEFWLAATIALLSRCDGAVFTNHWQRSSGARAEQAWCLENHMPHAFAENGLGELGNWLHALGSKVQ